MTAWTPSRRLSKSATILESILAAAPLGLGVLDRELRFVRANEALARGNGVPREDHIGRTITEVWPTTSPELVRRLHELLDHGEAVTDDETVSEHEGALPPRGHELLPGGRRHRRRARDRRRRLGRHRAHARGGGAAILGAAPARAARERPARRRQPRPGRAHHLLQPLPGRGQRLGAGGASRA